MKPLRFAAASAIAAACLPIVASAQWSSDPAANLAIGAGPSEQTQAKIRATSDGGCYVSWYSTAAGGFDLYLQRLDASGNERWAHNGVLVLDSALIGAQDYGLAVDAEDNAILTYRDDRPGSTQIGANKVSASGVLLWGPAGVVLGGSTNGNAPKVTVLSDGNYAVGYTASTSPATIVLQKLDSAGAPQWPGNGITLADPVPPTQRPLNLSDIQAADAGSVIVLAQRCTGSNCITSSKHLYAQKLDAAGVPLWAATGVAVFDGNSTQNGYFPTFIHDGSGGAVFGWYETGGTRRTLVQHVSAAGVELFAHNGVAGSLQASGRIALSPDIAYDAAADEIFMFWTEANSTQSQWGLYGQKFAAGVRQWGDGGREFVPLSTNQNAFVRCLAYRGGALVFAFDRSGSAQVIGLGADASGNTTWLGGVVPVCSVLAGKSRLDVTMSRCNEALLAWGDSRSDVRDIYGQNARPRNGALGGAIRGDVNCDGAVDFFDIDPFLALLFSPSAYESAYCGGSTCAGDVDCSGGVDFFDIDPFLACLFSVCPPCP